ncbi:hypothetical protein Tco_1236710 [Tanacetum coccineum]
MLGLANVETWDNIVKKFRMRIPERCADKSKGKRKSNGIIKPMICIEKFLIEDADGTNHAEDADGTNHSDLKTRLKNSKINKLIAVKPRWDIVVERKGKKRRENLRMIEIRSERKKLMTKIKEVNLEFDGWHYAITVVFGKSKGEVMQEEWEVELQTRETRFERQQKDVLVKKLSTEMTEKDVLVKKLSNEMTETKGMLSQLMNQLAAQGVQLNLSSQLQVASDVTPIGAYEVDGTPSSVVVRDKDARIQKKSNGLNQDVLDEEVTPPTTITQRFSDYNSAPKLQSKRKNYVSRETMQRQARTGKSHKSLNYGS